MKYSHNFMQFWYKPLINLSKNMRKKPKTDESILKIIILHKFEHSSLPIATIKQNKNIWARNHMQPSNIALLI